MTNNHASLAARSWALQGHDRLEPMLFRKSHQELFQNPELSPAEVEAIEEIRFLWQRVMDGIPNYREIIDLALRNLQRDLESPLRSEVVQELRREIEYRRWCGANVSDESFPDTRVDAVRSFPMDSSST